MVHKRQHQAAREAGKRKWLLTPAIIAMVDPIDEKGLEIVEEARKLGYGPLPPNMFTVLDQKFEVFAALNPSLQAAYDEACRPWMKASA
jgi:hypothetical protein